MEWSMLENAVFVISMILIAGLLCQWLAWRLKLPAILFLLLMGMLAGPTLHWLNPDKLLGDFLLPFVSLAVAVILFEGSLTLKLHDISGIQHVIRNLITIGALITWVITAFATHILLNFSWEVSFLFASLMVVTGPTVIIPMLRTVHLKENIANTLLWEGILIDPIGAILAVLTYQFIIAGDIAGGFMAGLQVFGKVLLTGMALGIIGGECLGTILRKFWIPQYLNNFATLTFLCAVFALSNFIEPESGLLAVTVMGVWLANMKGVELEDILNFKESLSILLISILFILLAARINFSSLIALGWPALILFAAIQLFIRPLSVHISSLGSKLSFAERNLVAWIAPRGIVAAAISTLFAIKLEALGYSDAYKMVPLTFLMIIGTVLLQCVTANTIAKIFKVNEPEPKGFLIVGANAVARAIATQLVENGFRVCLADEDRTNISAAKMKGLITYWGNPVSKHAERHLNLVGIGHLLIITPFVELNALVAAHYRLEFGANAVYTLQNAKSKSGKTGDRTTFKYEGRNLFGQVTYQDLERFLSSNAKIRTTMLTDEFTYDNYLEQHKEQCIPLFAIDPNDHIYLFTMESDFLPKANWRVIALTKGSD